MIAAGAPSTRASTDTGISPGATIDRKVAIPANVKPARASGFVWLRTSIASTAGSSSKRSSVDDSRVTPAGAAASGSAPSSGSRELIECVCTSKPQCRATSSARLVVVVRRAAQHARPLRQLPSSAAWSIAPTPASSCSRATVTSTAAHPSA